MLATLQTQRLLLRPYQQEDIDELHVLWMEPYVRQYLWDDVVIPRQTAEQTVAASLADVSVHGFGQWSLATLGGDGRIVGFCGFKPWEDGTEPEIVFGLTSSLWGQGLAFEAARAAILYLVRNTRTHKVWGATDEPNLRSQRLLERLGMKKISGGPGVKWPQVRYELTDFDCLLPFEGAYKTLLAATAGVPRSAPHLP